MDQPVLFVLLEVLAQIYFKVQNTEIFLQFLMYSLLLNVYTCVLNMKNIGSGRFSPRPAEVNVVLKDLH